MHKRNNVIITYIDKFFEENLEYDFLYSLQTYAGYEGMVYILDYGMTDDYAKRIRGLNNVKVVDCMKRMSVFSNRYYDISVLIDKLDDSVTDILVMDGGDVWFQNNINEIFGIPEKGIACVQEDRVFGKDEWTDKCLNMLGTDRLNEMLNVVGGKKVCNSGVICGKRTVIKEIFINVYKDIVDCGYEFFGIDQLYFNYELYKAKDICRYSLDSTFNYVLVSHKNEFYVDENGMITTNNGELISIVHNAGGNWRILDRQYQNKHHNTEQYVLENTYNIDTNKTN